MRDIDEISGIVVDVALKLHRDLGPGLLESVYEALLAAKLEKLGLVVERQRSIAVTFEDIHFPAAFKADLIVDGRLVIDDQIGRGHHQSAPQTASHLPSTYGAARRAAHQLWRRNPQGRLTQSRQ